jgi:hypothetical protein
METTPFGVPGEANQFGPKEPLSKLSVKIMVCDFAGRNARQISAESNTDFIF